MALIRITRGVPKFNIQIGPIQQALAFNPDAILSVTDFFSWENMQHPKFMWVPINEIGKPWGYMPFFAAKKILDFWCIEMAKFSDRPPLVYVGCSAGKHRSPLAVFCWLLSQEGQTPESVADEFFGKFDDQPLNLFKNDLEKGYLPENLKEFYRLMREHSGADYRSILLQMARYERVSYVTHNLVLND